MASVVGGQLESEHRVDHLAMADDLGDRTIDLVHRDRETDASGSAGRAVNRRVDSDQATGAVQQRPARITGIDRRKR